MNLLCLPILLLATTGTLSFQPSPRLPLSKRITSASLFLASDNSLDEIRTMRVKELKAELKERNIGTSDVFEKEELVKRLYEARQKSPAPSPPAPTPTTARPKPAGNVVEGDLLFTSMETGRSIPAFNRENIQIEGVGEPYPTIKIRVEDRFDLNLLLDTACSGFVLRPSIVTKYGMKSYNTAATMTGAGGNVQSAGVAQVGRFSFSGETFGTMPAAVQDIGALPTALDGIIGLSFLQQFVCSELDMEQGKLRLYKTERQPQIPPGMAVVAQAIMSRTQLGIFTVDVSLDGRGPVKMLVDTGATSSFLSWQGIADLGLSRSTVQPLANRIGALGSDNIAMQLTHTLPVTESVTFGQSPIGSGLTAPSNLSIDIGDIAILETQLKADKVVGILGMDLFLQCSIIRMSFTGSTPRVTLLK